ncbi:MAG: hypothetical protein GDA36_03420 [Rhodobacteraceae bacterium]|nr:hypothetical protein [Paracoccaceae bacterium]
MSEQADALKVYHSIREYCETYNIPPENLLDILEDQKVLPMIRDKATEYIGAAVLRQSLDPSDWSVDKLNLNPQPGAINEDVSITHRMTGETPESRDQECGSGQFQAGHAQHTCTAFCGQVSQIAQSHEQGNQRPLVDRRF